MTTYQGRDALIEAACNGSLTGTMVAEVTLMWGTQPRTFTASVFQQEPGTPVRAAKIAGQVVDLFSDEYNNLTLHTFRRLTVVGAR